MENKQTIISEKGCDLWILISHRGHLCYFCALVGTLQGSAEAVSSLGSAAGNSCLVLVQRSEVMLLWGLHLEEEGIYFCRLWLSAAQLGKVGADGSIAVFSLALELCAHDSPAHPAQQWVHPLGVFPNSHPFLALWELSSLQHNLLWPAGHTEVRKALWTWS